MDPYIEHRKTLFQFVTDKFSKNDYIRALNRDEDFVTSFESYEEFIQHQSDVITNLDLNTLTFLQQFQSLIGANTVEIMDKEDMLAYPGSGFIFSGGKIIFFHEA